MMIVDTGMTDENEECWANLSLKKSRMSARNSSLSPNESGSSNNPSRSRRDMLKQYYQGNQKDSKIVTPNSSSLSDGSQRSSKRVDPLDIDSSSYHPEVAFNKLIKEQNLIELLAHHNNLVLDIKEFDGNVKSLVYKNYSKFLAASNTVRKLKTTALDMDTQVLAVDQKMAQITSSIQHISDNLTPKRNRIEHLSGIHTLVNKLNFIIEMPQRLAEFVDSKKYCEAVVFYVQSINLLSRYRNVAMFHQIKKNCEELIKIVASKTQNKLFSGTATTMQISEGIGILVALQSLPASDLAKQFMYKVSDIVDRLLASQKGVIILIKQDNQSPFSNTPSESSLLSENGAQSAIIEEFTKFNRSFLTELGLFADCYDAYFVEKRVSSSVLSDLEALKKTSFASSFSNKDHENAHIDLQKFLKDKLDKYFSFLDFQLKLSSNLSHSAFNQCVLILNMLKNEVTNAVVLRKLAKVDSRMADLTVTVLDRIINGVFGKVNQDFFDKIKSLAAVPDTQVSNVIRQMTNWIKETLIAKALPTLEEFIVPDATNYSIGPSEILLRIKAALNQFWLGLASEMLDNKRKDNSSLYLILSRLSFEWSKGVIESIFSMYNERLFFKIGEKVFTPGLSEADITKCSADTTLMYQKLAQKLLSKYAQAQVLFFVFKIREYASKPLLLEEVMMVSQLWRDIRNELDTINQNIKKSFRDEQKTLGKGALHTQQPVSTGNKGPRKLAQKDGLQYDNLMDTLDKLFDERLVYLPQQIDLKPSLVIGTIIKSILKCLIEEIRQKTFDVKECHQFEVDLHFIRENFGDWLEHKTLDNMVDKAIKSAYQLCSTTAAPMDSALLSKIVAL